MIQAGRPIPDDLVRVVDAAGLQYSLIDPSTTDWRHSLTADVGVLVFNPCWVETGYFNATEIWRRFLLQYSPESPLFIAGYQQTSDPNELDLLNLRNYDLEWWQSALSVQMLASKPEHRDSSLMYKLQRFFAGHGSDSVVAVLSRVRLVVQMAQRELQKMQTPYSEIYADLVAPAQLAQKWTEWRNRWVNYYPLFTFTPIAAELKSIAEATQQLDAWMLAGGRDEQPLADDEILTILNAVRAKLQDIEGQYVIQKLSYSHS